MIAPRSVIRPLLGLALAALPAEAGAQEEQSIYLDGELGYGFLSEVEDERIHGGLLGVDFAYATSPFWRWRAGYALARHDSDGKAFTLHQPSIGLRYALDVFTYVPWIELSPTWLIADSDDGYSGPSVAVALGLDWLLSPSLTAGVAIRAHTLIDGGRFPGYTTIGLRLGRRWTLGDPFAP